MSDFDTALDNYKRIADQLGGAHREAQLTFAMAVLLAPDDFFDCITEARQQVRQRSKLRSRKPEDEALHIFECLASEWEASLEQIIQATATIDAMLKSVGLPSSLGNVSGSSALPQ